MKTKNTTANLWLKFQLLSTNGATQASLGIYRHGVQSALTKREAMMAMMDEKTKEHIRQLEANSRFRTGIGKLERGECEMGGQSPMACMVCPFGHMLCCHYPLTCEEAECSHYEREMVED